MGMPVLTVKAPQRLDIDFDIETRVFSVEVSGGSASQFSLSAADAKNLSETLAEIASDPQACSTARIWLDPSGNGGGYVDYR